VTWLLLLWAMRLPCDAACHARMAQPEPIWPWVVMFPFMFLLTNPQLAYMAYRAARDWIKG